MADRPFVGFNVERLAQSSPQGVSRPGSTPSSAPSRFGGEPPKPFQETFNIQSQLSDMALFSPYGDFNTLADGFMADGGNLRSQANSHEQDITAINQQAGADLAKAGYLESFAASLQARAMSDAAMPVSGSSASPVEAGPSIGLLSEPSSVMSGNALSQASVLRGRARATQSMADAVRSLGSRLLSLADGLFVKSGQYRSSSNSIRPVQGFRTDLTR